MIIGLLGIQGAIEEHERALLHAGADLGLNIELRRVTLPDHLEGLAGLVIPGGESTAMIKQGTRSGLLSILNKMLNNGFPIFGTCAGAILLAKHVKKTTESPITNGAFPYLDIEILRNGYGTQKDSFTMKFQVLEKEFEGVFIRAPIISSVGKTVEILAEARGNPVFVKAGNVIATTFHPELTEDSRIHEIFLQIIQENN